MRLLWAALLCAVTETHCSRLADPVVFEITQSQDIGLASPNAGHSVAGLPETAAAAAVPVEAAPAAAAAAAAAAAPVVVISASPPVDDAVAYVARGQSTQNRVTSGGDAAVGEFPWLAALVLRDGDFVYCSATVIVEFWLLTAAHCVRPYPGNELDVLVRKHLRATDPDEVRRRVTDIRLHPQFVPYAYINDIALLRVDQSLYPAAETIPLSFTPCTIQDPDSCLVGRTAVIAGWGLLQGDTFSLPTVLQKAEVPIIDNRNCERRYAYLQPATQILDSMLCAGNELGGEDTCQGDSGGPLVVSTGSGYTLEGVVSFGYGCGESGYHGVYQRVSSFTQWIAGELGTDVL